MSNENNSGKKFGFTFKKPDIKNISSKIKPSRVSVQNGMEMLQSNGKVLVLTVICAVIVMLFFCAVVFFMHVKGPEEVMVPEVRGKQLTDALIEMQNKELYPKITLRYSDTVGDEGSILDQNPDAGSIVKGYSRVSLVVSRGAIVDKVENYVGQNYEDIKLKLQTLFAGSAKPLIVLASPEYKPDVSEAGTILEQDPPEGTELSEPVTVSLVVSRGPNFENTRVPKLIGNSVNDMLQIMSRARVIFDFTSHIAQNDEKPGTIVSEQQFEDEFIPNYSRMSCEFAFPKGVVEDTVYGIFKADLADYPYPVPMRLDVTTDEETYTLLNFLHTGSSVTVPYSVPKNSTLTLYVVDKAVKKVQVQ